MAETAQTGAYSASTSSSGSGGGDVKEQAQEKAQQVKEQAKDQAQQAAGQAKSRARTEVDNRSTQLGQQVSQQASDLRSVSEQLRGQGKEGPAKVADQVATRVDSAGRWLTESDGDQLLNDLEDFGRRNPWAVIAGGVALGFLASRFLKASSRDRYERRGADGYGRADWRHQLPERASTGYGPASAPAGAGTIGGTPTTAPGTIGPGGLQTGVGGSASSGVAGDLESDRFAREAGLESDPLTDRRDIVGTEADLESDPLTPRRDVPGTEPPIPPSGTGGTTP